MEWRELKEFPSRDCTFLEHKLFEDQDGQDYLQHFVRLGAEVMPLLALHKLAISFRPPRMSMKI